MRSKKLISLAAFTLALGSLVGCNNQSGGNGGNPMPTEDMLSIHYQREKSDYNGWNLWLWEGGHDGGQYNFNKKDSYGVVAYYPLSTWEDPLTNQLGFIVRLNEWSQKDVDTDRYIDFSLLKQDDRRTYHVYLKQGDTNIYTDAEGSMTGQLKLCTFSTMTRLVLSANLGIKSYRVTQDDVEILNQTYTNPKKRVEANLPNDEVVDFTSTYKAYVELENGDNLSSVISKNLLFNTTTFEEQYAYDGNDLGVTYTESQSLFKVWSPAAKRIVLKVYSTGTPASLGGSDSALITLEMEKGEKGVWSTTVEGDLEGKYYTYAVYGGEHQGTEIVDPYAKSTGINGLRGMIVDFSKTNPVGWEDVDYLHYDRKELTVYETHVADLTSSSTWNGTPANQKLFKGFYETGTKYTSDGKTVSTGFDHIKELGVNAVQLIPIFDQANDERPDKMTFNWGYNPLNYNALEGGYSSDPYNGYARIKEFKELVKAYHDAGIEIIMDVVYNHVNGALNSNFDVLMPGYYYRYTSSGELSNGSGCGNETASENYMMRKFMIDSTKFWLSEYKLGGFRFDLMGLHDIDTMNALTAEAKAINPYVTIYGEPWEGGSTPLDPSKQADQANANKFVGYGAFNDAIRDSLIKGGLNAKTDVGWIGNKTSKVEQSDINKLTKGILGITAAGSGAINDPDKSTNYVTCHDNYTLYDRLIATGLYTKDDEDLLVKMNVLANSIIFTSQGTSFMLAGEEFLRTKYGNDNSYNASYQVNELDYSLKIKHLDMFESYKKMIALKQSLGALHLDKDHINGIDVTMTSNGGAIKYYLVDEATNREYIFLHANGLGDTSTTYNLDGFNLYWSTTQGNERKLSSETRLDKYETLVAYRNL